MQSDNDRNYIDELIVSYLTGGISAEKLKELTDWVKADKNNKRYFEGFSEIWVTSKAFLHSNKKYKKGFRDFKEKIGIFREVEINTRTILFSIAKVAAVALISFIMGGIIIPKIFNKEVKEVKLTFSEITVPRGALAKFSLFDGSEVTLNAGSKLRYSNSFGYKNREVILEGEAYFKVAKIKTCLLLLKHPMQILGHLVPNSMLKLIPTTKPLRQPWWRARLKLNRKLG
ncbi:MAG: FecR domain-containing protein [Bacteroidetes bacterium]|nr:FecR domain-containing protein [Bacteroidota bacterium]